MNVEKSEFILRFVESEIPSEIDKVLNDFDWELQPSSFNSVVFFC